MSHTKRLRELLTSPDTIVAPGMYDGLTGLLVEQAGFDAAYIGGASIAYSRLGRSDIGLTTCSEVADTVSKIRDRIEIPFVVDADTGFGNALNVQRTMRMFERAGASGIQLEDQTTPKRCGHLDGKTLVSTEEMVGKIKAAQDARLDENTVIVGRTDAIAVEGFNPALDRAEAYVEAGADMLFIEAPRSMEELKAAGDRFAGRVPLLANMVEGGKTPLSSAADLGALGFKFVIFPGAMVRIIAKAGQDYLKALQEDGSTAQVRDRMFDFNGLNNLLGTAELLESGKQYDPQAMKAAE
ncbi:MAG: isocitrate lyase/phosphoenolpyruvate mutase family protein [Rhodospirillaceae bacterium]|jgi:2-methylisocitrate lyase-like PEP mutase family enzyme|nr:isocitrate lyase/phosphoenolpyruvate mutase family protein [Rhodospirillaceae bacterium]